MDLSKWFPECTTEIKVNVRYIVPSVAVSFALLVQKPSVVRGQDIWFVNPASPIICSHDGNRNGWPHSDTVTLKTDSHQNFVWLSSFGGEVKPSVPCRRFAACKRSLELRGSQILDEICRNISHPWRVPPSATKRSLTSLDMKAPSGEGGNV